MGIINAMVESWHEACAKVDAEYYAENKVTPGSVIRIERDGKYYFSIYAGSNEVIQLSDGRVRKLTVKNMMGRDWGFFDVMKFNDGVNINRDGKVKSLLEMDVFKLPNLEDSLARAEASVGMTTTNLIVEGKGFFPFWCRLGDIVSSLMKASALESGSSLEELANSLDANDLEYVEEEQREMADFFEEIFGATVSRKVDIKYLNDN